MGVWAGGGGRGGFKAGGGRGGGGDRATHNGTQATTARRKTLSENPISAARAGATRSRYAQHQQRKVV